jgi:hypothetical protein
MSTNRGQLGGGQAFSSFTLFELIVVAAITIACGNQKAARLQQRS